MPGFEWLTSKEGKTKGNSHKFQNSLIISPLFHKKKQEICLLVEARMILAIESAQCLVRRHDTYRPLCATKHKILNSFSKNSTFSPHLKKRSTSNQLQSRFIHFTTLPTTVPGMLMVYKCSINRRDRSYWKQYISVNKIKELKKTN